MDVLDWGSGLGSSANFGAGTGNIHGGTSGTPGGESMMVDEDYMELMTDTLFSTISSNQPIYFPDPREIGNSQAVQRLHCILCKMMLKPGCRYLATSNRVTCICSARG